MGRSISSSSRSTCSPTAPSAAAPAVKSSVPTPTDRNRSRSSSLITMIADLAAVGPGLSGPVQSPHVYGPESRSSRHANQDHKTHALPQSDGRRQTVSPPISLDAGRARPSRHGLLRHRMTVSANAIPSPAPSPITANRSRKADISFVTEDLKKNSRCHRHHHGRLVHSLDRRQWRRSAGRQIQGDDQVQGRLLPPKPRQTFRKSREKTIRNSLRITPRKPQQSAKSLIPAGYGDARTTTLTAEVKPGSNTIPFTLSDQEAPPEPKGSSRRKPAVAGDRRRHRLSRGSPVDQRKSG